MTEQEFNLYMTERLRTMAETEKLNAERMKMLTETGLMGRNSIFAAMTAAAALLTAGAVLAKLFF
jgi:hypothetical protein